MMINRTLCNRCPKLHNVNVIRTWVHFDVPLSAIHSLHLLCAPLTQYRGCDREVSDNDSASPLLLAAMWDRAEAVRALIIGGCELNVTDKDGKSAVYWAAEEGNMDVLRVRICGVCVVCVCVWCVRVIVHVNVYPLIIFNASCNYSG